MVESMSKTGFYSILITVLIAVFCFGYVVPAFNNLTYDANYSYVVEVYQKFEKNKQVYKNNWKLAKDKNYIEYNKILTVPSNVGYPSFDITKNKNEILTACQDIWISLSDTYGEIADFDNITANSIFFIDYNVNTNSCLYIYVDPEHVNTESNTHVVTYNLSNGNTGLFKNKFNFNIGSSNV